MESTPEQRSSPFPPSFDHHSWFIDTTPSGKPNNRAPKHPFPIAYIDAQNNLSISRSISQESLRADLSVDRLNQLHAHLWWTGIPQAARPLHRQKMWGRQITVTEQADLHLLWVDDHIFIKPLPTYLLDRAIWTQHLCPDTQLYEAARGILLSYIWLIRHKSDLDVARDHRLVPDISWQEWSTFVYTLSHTIDPNAPTAVSPRYDFGELRIRRLNQIVRLRCALALDLGGFITGYVRSYTHYAPFFRNNFQWIIIAFAYGTVLLSALQVGLGVDSLRTQNWFQKLCLGFAMSLTALPLLLAVLAIFSFLGLFLYFLGHTLRLNEERFGERRHYGQPGSK